MTATVEAAKGRAPKTPTVKKPPTKKTDSKKADTSSERTTAPKRPRGRPRKNPLVIAPDTNAVVQDTVVENGPESMEKSVKEGDAEEASEETKLKRQIKKSRIILEVQEYQKDITHANELIHARKNLGQDWKDLEAKNPP